MEQPTSPQIQSMDEPFKKIEDATFEFNAKLEL
jgi:hypothetical protein